MPVVVMCTVCKQRSRVLEDMVGKAVKCPSCGQNFVARPESAGAAPVAPAPVIKKSGGKAPEPRPSRTRESRAGWTDLEEASPRRSSSRREQPRGSSRMLWVILALVATAGIAGGVVVVVMNNNEDDQEFAGGPGVVKKGDEELKKELEKKAEAKKDNEGDKKGESPLKKGSEETKKGETEKKGDIKDKPGPVETAGSASLKVKTSHIMAAGFSKDGKELLVCGRDGDLTWYDAQSLTKKRALPMPEHKKGLDGIDIARDGKTLLAVSFGTLIELVDSASGERNTVVAKTGGNYRGSAISDNAKVGATLIDQMIYVWDLSERKLLKKFNPHQGLPLGVALSPDGKLLASSGQVDDSVTLTDTAAFKEVAILQRAGGRKSRGGNFSSSPPAFSHDGKYLAYPSAGNTLIIYHIPSKKERMALKVESKSTATGNVSFSGDGNTVALGVGDGSVHLWDVRTGERRAILSMNIKGKSDIVDSVRFSPDDKKVMAAARLNERVFVWDLTRVKLEPVDLAKTITDPGSTPVAVTGEGGFTFLKDKGQVLSAAFSKDAKEILICTRDGSMKWYDTASMTEKRVLPKPEKYIGIGTADINPEGKSVLAISFESLVEAVDGVSGDRLGLPTKLRFPLPIACISRDGKVAAAYLGKVVVWDVSKRAVLTEWSVGSIRAMALSADGKWLASGEMSDDTHTVWDSASGKAVAHLIPASGKKDRISVFHSKPAFSTDNKYLATTALGNQLVIYHLPSKKQRMSLKIETKATAMSSAVFSNDGNTVAQGVLDGTIHLFDVRTGERRAILSMGDPAGFHFMDSLQFSGDDTKLLASDRNQNKVFVWDLTKVKLEPVDLAKTIKDPTIAFNPKNPKDPKNPKGTKPVGDKEIFKYAGNIGPSLGIVADVDSGSVLTTMPKGLLRQLSYPEFKLQGVYKLGGTAYRPTLDRKNGLLYALVPNPKAKPAVPAGKRGGNELHVYDVSNVLAGKITSGNTLRPSKVIPLQLVASQLLLSPDGGWLHVLDSANAKSIKLIRLDAAKGERAGELALAENTDCLCLTRDGKKILAGAHAGTRSSTKSKPHQGSIQVIDAETMKLDKTIAVALDPFSLETSDGGLVFASGGSGPKTDIVVIDLKLPEPIATWEGVPTGCWLRLSDDQRRLFLHSWRSNQAIVTALFLPAKMAGSALPSGNAQPVPQLSPRGELTATADGQFLLSEAGAIFQLKE